jgi:CheY-like chemotaxis protein
MSVNCSFLVVDDSYIDRLVTGMLVRHTFGVTEVYEVSGGHQAIEWLSSTTINPGTRLIILLDIMMPQMNGFEFLLKFDKLDEAIRNNTSVIMLSSTLDHDDLKKAQEHHCVKKFLSKPLSANELKEFVM